MSYRLIAAAAALVALQGCTSKPPPVIVATEDFNVGMATTCTFSPVLPLPGSSVSATISMTNDGWCAVRATEADGQPFALGLVRQRPEHGTVLIQKLGGQTRLEYTAAPGFTGTDAFTAALRTRAGTDATVQVAVTVAPGGGSAAPTPAPESKPSATSRGAGSKPARRSRR